MSTSLPRRKRNQNRLTVLRDEQTTLRKGKGFHPGLALLGIGDWLSPATLDLLAKSAAALGSMHDAKNALADQGIRVSVTRISTAVRASAFQARTLRTNNPSLETVQIAGRKIVVSVDGGRIRIRKNKKGPKTKKSRTRYSTEWREPKLLCIYFLDENGDVDRSIPLSARLLSHEGISARPCGGGERWDEKEADFLDSSDDEVSVRRQQCFV